MNNRTLVRELADHDDRQLMDIGLVRGEDGSLRLAADPALPAGYAAADQPLCRRDGHDPNHPARSPRRPLPHQRQWPRHSDPGRRLSLRPAIHRLPPVRGRPGWRLQPELRDPAPVRPTGAFFYSGTVTNSRALRRSSRMMASPLAMMAAMPIKASGLGNSPNTISPDRHRPDGKAVEERRDHPRRAEPIGDEDAVMPQGHEESGGQHVEQVLPARHHHILGQHHAEAGHGQHDGVGRESGHERRDRRRHAAAGDVAQGETESAGEGEQRGGREAARIGLRHQQRPR